VTSYLVTDSSMIESQPMRLQSTDGFSVRSDYSGAEHHVAVAT